MTTDGVRRPWRHHAVATIGLVVAFLAAYAAWIAFYSFFEASCVNYDSEGIALAPESWQGRVVCNDDGEQLAFGWVWIPPFVTLVVALVLWIRRARVALVATLLFLTPTMPLLTAGAVALLPADCTQAQWQEYGAHGCERDREAR